MASRLSSQEIVNKANAIVDAEERGETWNVTGLSPNSDARLQARVAIERRTRAAVRRSTGQKAKSRKKGKARKSKRR